MQIYFFGDSNNPLLGTYHPPVSGYGNNAVLLCYPILHEYMRTHWAFRRLSKMLSEAGYHVFRFDYYGTGDSSGDGNEISLQQWESNVLSAFQELKDVSGAENLYVVSTRFGAALSTLASTNNGFKPKCCIFWDPVLDGRRYLEELKTLNDSRNISPETSGNPNFEELMGYIFPETIREEMLKLNLLPQLEACALKTTLLFSENTEESRLWGNDAVEKPEKFEILTVDESCDWDNPQIFDQALIVTKVLHTIVEIIDRKAQ